MKITNYEKNHGKFVHEDWLQKIINLVPNLVQLTDAKSIEAIHFEDDVTLVDYINQDGGLVEGETVASYLTANVTGDGSMGHIKTISFLNVYGNPTVLAGIELEDYDRNVPIKGFNFDDSIRYAFDNSSDKFTANTSRLGVVKVDGDTIKADEDGKIVAKQPPIATTEKAGLVQPDGNTITVTENGKISADPNAIVKVDGKTIKKAIDGTISADTNEIVKVDGKTITVDENGKLTVPDKQEQEQLIKVVATPIPGKTENAFTERPFTLYLTKVMLDEHYYIYKVVFASGSIKVIGDIKKGDDVLNFSGNFGNGGQTLIFKENGTGRNVQFDYYVNDDGSINATEDLALNSVYSTATVY